MRSPQRALTILLLALAAAHLAFARFQGEPTAFGDETHYTKVARRDLAEGTLGLLPGTLRPGMRPELAGRVLALLAPPDWPTGVLQEDARALIERAFWLQLLLHLATVLLVYRQGRLLGLDGRGSLAAAAAWGLFPWSSFHVHALWPETLHACLAALALTGLLEFRRRRQRPGPGRWAALAGAGLALGYALLTKSTLSLAVPVTGAFVFAWGFGGAPGGARDVRRALGSLALYGGALALVLLPQMRANERAGFGLGLGANRWWNLELALRTPARVVAPEGIDDPYGLARWELQRALTDDYMATSTDPLVRERAARERVRAHLAAEGWGAAVSEQLTEFLDVLLARGGLSFYRAPCLEQALGYRARWGAPPPGWIAALARPARPLWWLLLAVGTFGLARGCRRGAGEPLEGDPAGDRGGYLLVLALALCVLAVVLAVPLKFRFLQPLIPLLCLGVGAVCARRPSSARV